MDPLNVLPHPGLKSGVGQGSPDTWTQKQKTAQTVWNRDPISRVDSRFGPISRPISRRAARFFLFTIVIRRNCFLSRRGSEEN